MSQGKDIVMAEKDYYALLELSINASADEINASYKRLARKRHPDKDRLNPGATEAFQLLSEAYETLNDVAKRSIYDRIRKQSKTTSAQTFSQSRYPTSSQADPQSTGQEKQAQDQEIARLRKDAAAVLVQLSAFRRARAQKVEEREDLWKKVQDLQAEMEALDKKDREADEADIHSKSLFGRLQSFVWRQSEEDKMKREQERLQRIAARRIKEPALERAREIWRQNNTQVEQRNAQISLMEGKLSLIQQQMTQKENQRRQAEYAKQQARERAESEKRAKEEQDRFWENFRAQQEEQARAAQARRDEAAEYRRRWEAGVRNGAGGGRPGTSTNQGSWRSACSHRRFWTRIEGVHTCEHCQETYYKFSFQCPDCSLRACAGCRKILRGR